MKRPLAVLLATLFAIVLLASCGSDSDSGGSSSEETTRPPTAGGIAVDATEFAFDPDEIEVAADEEFTITLVNGGAVEHDFTIEGQEDRKVSVTPGQTAEGTFRVPAGETVFYCSIPGHREAGMEGTITAAA